MLGLSLRMKKNESTPPPRDGNVSSLRNNLINLVFKTNYGLMQVKSITDCSKGSILHYFRPSLSYFLSL